MTEDELTRARVLCDSLGDTFWPELKSTLSKLIDEVRLRHERSSETAAEAVARHDRDPARYWAERELEVDARGYRIPRLADCDIPKAHLRDALDENAKLRARVADLEAGRAVDDRAYAALTDARNKLQGAFDDVWAQMTRERSEKEVAWKRRDVLWTTLQSTNECFEQALDEWEARLQVPITRPCIQTEMARTIIAARRKMIKETK